MTAWLATLLVPAAWWFAGGQLASDVIVHCVLSCYELSKLRFVEAFQDVLGVELHPPPAGFPGRHTQSN